MNDDDRRFRMFIVAAVVVVALYLVYCFVSDILLYRSFASFIEALQVL